MGLEFVRNTVRVVEDLYFERIANISSHGTLPERKQGL